MCCLLTYVKQQIDHLNVSPPDGKVQGRGSVVLWLKADLSAAVEQHRHDVHGAGENGVVKGSSGEERLLGEKVDNYTE